jgi:predicted dinucleotide-utilizing enzyme
MTAVAMAPLQIAVIGVGRIGRLHAELLARRIPGAALGPVYDACDTRTRDVASEFGVPAAASVDEILAGDADAVAICSNAASHAELMVAAARAGKAIFCEKPVSLELEELDRALAVVKESGSRFRSASTAGSIPPTPRCGPPSLPATSASRTWCGSPAVTRRPRRSTTCGRQAASSWT